VNEATGFDKESVNRSMEMNCSHKAIAGGAAAAAPEWVRSLAC
jgi:hypothetical protein